MPARSDQLLSGILPVDKPAGWTSHDVVARVRRLSGQRQVGHAGTLDPLATGVLLLVLGRATRLSSYLMDTVKEYRADVVLGARTVTDDAEAPLLGAPAGVSHLTREQIEQSLAGFLGEIDQVPPAYAAIKQGGQKLYALARRGVEVEAPPRHVRIESLEIEAWRPPRLYLRVRCAAGTYIRSLARDIGVVLGVGGYLHALRRTRSGTFHESDCVSLAEVAEAADRGTLAKLPSPPDRAVLSWPAAVLSAADGVAVSHGRPVPFRAGTSSNVRLYGASGRLVALATLEEGLARPFLVFPSDVRSE